LSRSQGICAAYVGANLPSTLALGNRPFHPPEHLGPVINSPDADSGPSVSADGLTLVFNSTRPGGEGGSDIWMSTRSAIDQPWGEPANLGSMVNSMGSDTNPSLSADGLALFFESERLWGCGKADIWMTTRSAVDAAWDEPVNLGTFVNTPETESGPALADNDTVLYFSSDGIGGQGSADLWMVPLKRPSLPTERPEQAKRLDPAEFGLTIHEPAWTLVQIVRRPNGFSAAGFHPLTGQLYFGTKRGLTRWIRRLNPDGSVRSVYDVAGHCFAFSPDGSQLLVPDVDNLIAQIDVKTGQQVRVFDPKPKEDDDPAGIAFPPSGWTGTQLSRQQALCIDTGYNGPHGLWRISLDGSAPEQIAKNADDLLDPNDLTITRSEVYVINRVRSRIGPWEIGQTRDDDYNRRIYRLEDDMLVPIRTDRPIFDPAGIAFDPVSSDLLVVCGYYLSDPEAKTVLRIRRDADQDQYRVTDVFSGFKEPVRCGIDVSVDGRRVAITDHKDGAIYVFSRAEDVKTTP